jgi:hypothetical protein
MKINRLELIAKIQVIIAEREKASETKKAEAYTKAGNAEAEYVKDHGADWDRFATRIRACLRKGSAITINDVPEGLRSGGSGWHASVNLFRPNRVNSSEYVPRTEPLTRLLAVLESCPDEFVSTSTLSLIGAPLKELLRP